MNEKISKAFIILEMIVIAFPITLLIIIADVAMITSLFSEFNETSNVSGNLLFLVMLNMCSIAMFSYFYLAINFMRKGRTYSCKRRGLHFYVVLVACVVVLLSYIINMMSFYFPALKMLVTIFDFGIPMVVASLHILLEHGLVNLLTSKGNRRLTARLL